MTRTSPKSMTAFLVATVIALAALSACNTIEGAGADIKSGGKAIEEAAK